MDSREKLCRQNPSFPSFEPIFPIFCINPSFPSIQTKDGFWKDGLTEKNPSFPSFQNPSFPSYPSLKDGLPTPAPDNFILPRDWRILINSCRKFDLKSWISGEYLEKKNFSKIYLLKMTKVNPLITHANLCVVTRGATTLLQSLYAFSRGKEWNFSRKLTFLGSQGFALSYVIRHMRFLLW